MTVDRTLSEQHGHALDVVHRFFELLHRKDIAAWAELWADGGRIIIPYPPKGFDSRIEGKPAILTAFRALFADFSSYDYELTGVYPAADSDAICVEYNVDAVLVGGVEYRNRNLAIFRFRDGLIEAYHDYFDPRRFQTVVDALTEA